jgi:hypothetical protein
MTYRYSSDSHDSAVEFPGKRERPAHSPPSGLPSICRAIDFPRGPETILQFRSHRTAPRLLGCLDLLPNIEFGQDRLAVGRTANRCGSSTRKTSCRAKDSLAAARSRSGEVRSSKQPRACRCTTRVIGMPFMNSWSGTAWTAALFQPTLRHRTHLEFRKLALRGGLTRTELRTRTSTIAQRCTEYVTDPTRSVTRSRTSILKLEVPACGDTVLKSTTA